MNQLVKGGKVRRGLLGVGVQAVTSDLAASLGLKNVGGILVNSVTPGGPADQAGIKAGDVITQINGTPVNDTNVLRNMVASTAPGTEINLAVLRNSNEQQFHVKVGELSAKNVGASSEQGNAAPTGAGRLGLSLAPLSAEVASQLGLSRATQGLVVESVDPNGAAADAGIQEGDVIQQVNRQPVHTTEDVRSALEKSGDRPPLLLINRHGQTVFVPVPLK